jgi:hypothetical protein
MTTVNFTTSLETLIDLGLVTEGQVVQWNRKLARQEARAQARQLVQGTADSIMTLLSSETQSENKYFSVKKTSNSVGFMDFVEADRATVLKALTQLVSEDKIRKTGLVGGEEKPVSEVNAFQIRYARA